MIKTINVQSFWDEPESKIILTIYSGSACRSMLLAPLIREGVNWRPIIGKEWRGDCYVLKSHTRVAALDPGLNSYMSESRYLEHQVELGVIGYPTDDRRDDGFHFFKWLCDLKSSRQFWAEQIMDYARLVPNAWPLVPHFKPVYIYRGHELPYQNEPKMPWDFDGTVQRNATIMEISVTPIVQQMSLMLKDRWDDETKERIGLAKLLRQMFKPETYEAAA